MATWKQALGTPYANPENLKAGWHEGTLTGMSFEEDENRVNLDFSVNEKVLSKRVGLDSNKARYWLNLKLAELGVELPDTELKGALSLNVPVRVQVVHSEGYCNIEDLQTPAKGKGKGAAATSATTTKAATPKGKGKPTKKEESPYTFVWFSEICYLVTEEREDEGGAVIDIKAVDGEEYTLTANDGDVWTEATTEDAETAGFDVVTPF